MSRARDAYSDQKYRAARRNIPFEISFEDWVAWWKQQLGPDWLKKRGPRRDDYVMARYGDSGPYKIGNIKCITCSQNIREQQTPEWRAKISAAMMGNQHAPGHKQIITNEQRAKLSAALKGHEITAETRAKISAAMMGNKSFLGRKHSPEAKAKLSASALRRSRTLRGFFTPKQYSGVVLP